jgi:peptidoglycan/LPS O-acetylase OafA/YrhL
MGQAYPELRQSPRYETLDAWRGMACLLVIVFHSTFYLGHAKPFSPEHASTWAAAAAQRMWVGVPIFFVISGYCIAATADSSRRRDLGLRSFLARRVRRIFPPYLICVAIAAPLVGLLDFARPGLFCDDVHGIIRPWHLDRWQILGNLTLTEGWRHHLFGSGSVYFLGQAWSLVYEEQFYLVTGLLLFACARWFFAGVLAITLVSLAAGKFVPEGFFPHCWPQFAAGVLVYYTSVYVRRRHARLFAAPLAIGLIYAVCDPHDLITKNATPRQFALTAYGFALVILWLRPFDTRLVSWPVVRPLRACGAMCYSLYLVHWPVCKLMSHCAWLLGIRTTAATFLITVPACLAASILVGRAFHRCVECRFLNSPHSAAPQPGEPTAARPPAVLKAAA